MKHPVHPLVVHFPISCWSLSTLGDLASILFAISYPRMIGVLMFIGFISSIIAVAAGLYETGKLKSNDQLIINAVDHHMYAAVATLCLYSLSLFLRWDNGFTAEPNIWAFLTSILGFASLIVTGWYGASLVYFHGVGTSKHS